jgi:hypothetical protein
MLLRVAPILLFVVAGIGVSSTGCSNGTTPVCDDAGSCLILPPGDGGQGADTASAADAGSGEASDDGGAE